MFPKLTKAVGVGALVLLTAAQAFAEESGHGGEGAPGWFRVIAQAVNLVLLVGLLAYFGGRPTRRFLQGRAEIVTKEIDEARRLHQEAEARLAEYEAKLGSLQQEAEALLAEMRREGEAEKARLIAEAKAEAERVAKDAERLAANEVARARTRLEAEVADRALEVAEKILREQMNADDARRLTEDYLGQLEQRAGA